MTDSDIGEINELSIQYVRLSLQTQAESIRFGSWRGLETGGVEWEYFAPIYLYIQYTTFYCDFQDPIYPVFVIRVAFTISVGEIVDKLIKTISRVI